MDGDSRFLKFSLNLLLLLGRWAFLDVFIFHYLFRYKADCKGHHLGISGYHVIINKWSKISKFS